MSNYPESYNNSGFLTSLKNIIKRAGAVIVELALKLYYAAQDPDTPKAAKITIYGALAYLISPVDAIPDITPVIGYTDDLGVLTVAVATVAMYIKPEHVAKAKAKMELWFG